MWTKEKRSEYMKKYYSKKKQEVWELEFLRLKNEKQKKRYKENSEYYKSQAKKKYYENKGIEKIVRVKNIIKKYKIQVIKNKILLKQPYKWVEEISDFKIIEWVLVYGKWDNIHKIKWIQDLTINKRVLIKDWILIL